VFYINFTNQTDVEVYEVHIEYFPGDFACGVSLMENADHSMITKGGTI